MFKMCIRDSLNIDDVSDKMIDLSGYDFTDNYVESRLQGLGTVSYTHLPKIQRVYG